MSRRTLNGLPQAKGPDLGRRAAWKTIGALAGAGMLGMITLSAGAQNAPKEHVVTMANMSFGKLPANVKVGDAIVWINRDTVPHTATARDRSFDVRVGAGQRARMIVKKGGNIAFYCIFHPAMRATLSVTP